MNEVRKSPAVQDRAKPLLSRFSNALASIVGKPSQKGQASSVGKGKEKTSKEKGLSPHNTATPQHPKINQEEAWAECQELAQEPRILDRFADDLKRCGLVGEKRAAKLVYLALTSRHLDRPISAVIKGPSSSGKSHLLDCTLRFFPPSAYYRLTAMSERALVYGNEPLKHRTLVVAEASGLAHGVGAYLIRSLISEGNLRYETVLKDKDKMGVVTFDREGPTGLLVTTTRSSLDAELETRIFSIPIDDSPEQTRAILLAMARPVGGVELDFDHWHALQAWLESGEHRVETPFADKLLEAIPPVAVRLRRDIGAVQNLIATHAILHQASREKAEDGSIIATYEDYAAVYELVADLVAEGVNTTVKSTVRETVEAVIRLKHKLPCGIALSVLAKELGLDKSTVSRRVTTAIDLGYLHNMEKSRGKPARCVEGNPLPEEVQILPRPEALASGDL